MTAMDERNIYLEDIPLDEARARLSAALEAAGKATPLPGERVALDDALGRVTAEPVWALISSPHYHAAAMDGYAVRAADTLGDRNAARRAAVPEQAHPVNTGAPLRIAATPWIMIEQTQALGDDRIEIRAPVAPWQHVRMMGERYGRYRADPARQPRPAPARSWRDCRCGHSTSWYAAARVAILPPAPSWWGRTAPRPGDVIRYNSIVLGAQVRAAGGEFTRWTALPDDQDAIRAAIVEAAADHDLVLVLSDRRQVRAISRQARSARPGRCWSTVWRCGPATR